jgi:hypothetical protein
MSNLPHPLFRKEGYKKADLTFITPTMIMVIPNELKDLVTA